MMELKDFLQEIAAETEQELKKQLPEEKGP